MTLKYLILTLAALTLSFQTLDAKPINEASKSSWKRHSNIGQGPRQEHAVVAMDQDIYIVGGVAYNTSSSLDTVGRVEVYNTASQSWHVAAPLPRTLNHANAAVVNDKMYILGGLSGGDQWAAVADSYMYDPFNDTWISLAPLPSGTAKGASAVGVFNSTIYLAGGLSLLQPFPGGIQPSVASVLAYNTRTYFLFCLTIDASFSNMRRTSSKFI